MHPARQRQDKLLVQVTGCVDGFDEESSLVLTYRSSYVTVGPNDGVNKEWSTTVALEIRTRVPQYFKGVTANGPSSRASAEDYASFLARSFPQEVIDLNKYAIVYRFCEEIPMPVRNGTSWEEEFEFASSEVRLIVTVEEWAIVLAVCWVIAVMMAYLLVTLVAAWKKMPNNVLGEQDILRRWAEENDVNQMDRGTVALLTVIGGMQGGRITAHLKRM